MAISNGLDPTIQTLRFAGNSVITSGTAGYTAALITGLVGTYVAGGGVGNGSIYICNNATTPGIWINVAGTWTSLTVN